MTLLKSNESKLMLPTRRGFVLGLSALVAAPAIVKFDSLMPVRSIDKLLRTAEQLYSRSIAEYDPVTEHWRVSIDRAWQPLPMPQNGVQVSASIINRLIPEAQSSHMTPPPGGHRHIGVSVPKLQFELLRKIEQS